MPCIKDWVSCDWLGFLFIIRCFIWAGYYIKIEIPVLEASVQLKNRQTDNVRLDHKLRRTSESCRCRNYNLLKSSSPIRKCSLRLWFSIPCVSSEFSPAFPRLLWIMLKWAVLTHDHMILTAFRDIAVCSSPALLRKQQDNQTGSSLAAGALCLSLLTDFSLILSTSFILTCARRPAPCSSFSICLPSARCPFTDDVSGSIMLATAPPDSCLSRVPTVNLISSVTGSAH